MELIVKSDLFKPFNGKLIDRQRKENTGDDLNCYAIYKELRYMTDNRGLYVVPVEVVEDNETKTVKYEKFDLWKIIIKYGS